MNCPLPELAAARTSRADPPGQVFGLDVIRFAAARAVVAHHLAFGIWAGGHYAVNYQYLGPFAWGGFIGVEIFFVLSGFIIAYTAEHATGLAFVKNRVIRLYPTACICATFTVAVLTFFGAERLDRVLLKEWVRSVIFFPHGPYVDGSYWTLPIEVSFYCVILVLLLLNRFRWLSWVMSAIGLVSGSSWMYFAAAQHSLLRPSQLGMRYLDFLTGRWQAQSLLLDYGCFFAIGSLLWLCLLRKATVWRIVVLLYCLLACTFEVRFHCRQILHQYKSDYPLLMPEALWVVGIVATVAAVHYNSAIGRWLGPKGARFTRRLGVITYPLYLIHQVVGFLLIHAFLGFMPALSALLVTALFLIVGSFAIHTFFEKPLQKALRKIMHLPATRPTPAASLP